jgi:hypothetical protein
MWWLYTHRCETGTWTLMTNQDAPVPSAGEEVVIPPEIRLAGAHFYALGFHIGLRFTTRKMGVDPNLQDGAATMLRIVSLRTTKPWSCTYEEPNETRWTPD